MWNVNLNTCAYSRQIGVLKGGQKVPKIKGRKGPSKYSQSTSNGPTF